MKYSEFRVEVEVIGLHIGVYELNIDVVDKHGDTVGCIAKDVEMSMDTDFDDFRKLPQEKKIVVFESLYELAKTPLAEREEEKRYWLQKIPVPLLDKGTEKKWLWKYTGTKNFNSFGTDMTRRNSGIYKTIFTESEIAEMDITGFKKIEVMDGE